MSKILAVRVKPGAKKTEILSKEDIWEIAVAAPPDKNKANKELIRFLSKHLKRKVRIKSGHKSRDKLLILE
ncbi:MAG TPA: DUF167 domain-containing protein [Candidatus Nanoarchaeia archaeon]|nr:DUF167 domain-containing protein [Candidatus Nanoarchaeia archaeon]